MGFKSRITLTKIKKEIILLIVFILLILGNSFFLRTSSIIASEYQIDREEEISSFQSTKPKQLDSIVYDHYTNGKVINRGNSKNLLPRSSSTYSHPLSKNETLVINRDELAIMSTQLDEESFILDDSSTEFENIHEFSAIYSYSASNFVAGNIDEDPNDELLVISCGGLGYAAVHLYDDANHSHILFWNQSITIDSLHEVHSSAVEVGNFDEDPLNEFVVALMLWVPGDMDSFYVYFFVFDLNNSPTEIDFEPVWAGTQRAYGFIDLDTGDFDKDGMDEFVITLGIHYGEDNCWVFDDSLHNFVQLGTTFGSWGTRGQVEVGDFDGDGVEEIATAHSNFYAIEIQTLGMDMIPIDPIFYPSVAIWKFVGGSFEATELDLVNHYIHYITITSGDLDGDGRDELAVFTQPSLCWADTAYWNLDRRGYIYEYSDTTYDYGITKVWTDSSYYPNGDPYLFLDNFFFATGDIDGDGMDEIISSGIDTTTMALNDAKSGYAPMMVPNEIYYGRIACGDFDGDGMVLQYTGESCVTDAPPAVVAVIAAPPCYANIDQNYASSWTAWGTETMYGSELSTAVGTTASTTISFEQKFEFFEFLSIGGSFSKTFREEFARTNTIEKTEAVSQSFDSGWMDDAVVFHQTSYTSYLYKITSHPFNESLVGTYMTIDVPSVPILHKVGLDEFNENYEGIDIGDETFTHTAGQPWTYPSREDVPLITKSWLDSGDPQEVGQGSGFNFAEIQITETIYKGFETTKASEFATGCSVGAKYSIVDSILGGETEISFEYSQGAFETKAYSVFTGERTYYEGAVGDIADWDVWNQTKYTYGLFIYYQSHPKGCLYHVVNYYVDGAIPYPPRNTNMELVREFFQNNWPWIVGIGGTGILTAIITVPLTILVRKRRLKS